MKLLKTLLSTEPEAMLVAWGHCLLRVGVGAMIFYVHGLHKLEGGLAYWREGTPWKLVEEVSGMHAPAPLFSAWLATVVQFICSLFVVAGLFTRINAALLVCALSGAILQNLLAGRDPQLAVLYTLAVIALALMGGGKISLDARLFAQKVRIESPIQ